MISEIRFLTRLPHFAGRGRVSALLSALYRSLRPTLGDGDESRGIEEPLKNGSKQQELPVKIAFNALSVQGGGGVTFLKNLLKHLLRIDRENEFLVLATARQRNLLGLSNGSYANLRTIECPERGWIARSVWEQTALPIVLRREKVDVLYAPGNQGPIFSAFPFVVVVQNVEPLVGIDHGMSMASRIKTRALRYMTKSSVRKARRVIAVSEYTRQLLLRQFGYDSKDIVVIPHGSPDDADLLSPVDALGYVGTRKIEGRYLLAVSNIKYNKNYEALVDAFSIVFRRIPNPLCLVIAGGAEDRRCFSRLKRLVQQNGVASWVYFLGSVDHETIRHLYAGAEAVVFPSRIESFGLPPLEAMAYSVPVVASRIEPILEVCGDAAVYFDPRDPEDMARAMERLIADRSLRTTLVARGRVQAGRFSWETTARRTLEVLEAAASY